MVGLLSRTAILERIEGMIERGIIQRENEQGTTTRYLLNFELVNSLLELSENGQVGLSGNGQVSCSETDKNLSGNGQVGADVSYVVKKQERSNELGEEADSQPNPLSDSDLNLEDQTDTFLVNSWRRVRGVRLKLNRKQDAHTVERCRVLDSTHGDGQFRRAALLYLADESDWLRQEKWPIYAFLSQVESWLDRAGSSPAPAASPEDNGGGGAVTHAEIAPASPAGSGGLPLAAAEWNRIVTAGPPVERWTQRDRGMSPGDPDFLAVLPTILERCQKIHQAMGEESSWLTFRWLLKRKSPLEAENWYKILNGEMAWATAKKKSTTGRDPEYQAYLDKLAEEDRADYTRESETD